MNKTRRTIRKPPRGTKTSGILGKSCYLSWLLGGITDGKGNYYTLEHARELISLGMAETNHHKLLEALGMRRSV